MVTVDPRRTETADGVGEHHFIRPGTDAALLLAMLSKESAYATWLLLLGVACLGSKRMPLPQRALLLPGLRAIGLSAHDHVTDDAVFH